MGTVKPNRDDLEKGVEDTYALLAELTRESGEVSEETIGSIRKLISDLCVLARTTESRIDYEWAANKFLHLEAILVERFGTSSKENYPFTERELVG